MNTLKLTSVVVMILFSYQVNAANYKFVAMDNSISTKMCVLAGSNDKTQLKKTMRLSGHNNRFIANNIKCNDMIMVQFANHYGAANTTKHLNRYTRFINRVPETSVTIRDIAAVNDEAKIIYISAAN